MSSFCCQERTRGSRGFRLFWSARRDARRSVVRGGGLQQVQLWEHVPRVAALPLANARGDPLHLPLDVGAALALEVHGDHARLVGHAAALVSAHPAVGGPELLGARTTWQVELLGFLGLELWPTRLPTRHLWEQRKEKNRAGGFQPAWPTIKRTFFICIIELFCCCTRWWQEFWHNHLTSHLV